MSNFLVMNVNHAEGISKKTGKAYDFTVLTAYKPNVLNDENFKGLKPMEFYCEKSILKSIPELPSVCSVEYDLEPGFNGQAQMTVTSVKLVKKIDIQF